MSDIALNPAQGGNLIEKSVVSRDSASGLAREEKIIHFIAITRGLFALLEKDVMRALI